MSPVDLSRPSMSAALIVALFFTMALLVTRRKVIAKMDALRAQIQASGTSAVRAFRRIHVAAILVNLAQLVLIVWSLIAVSTAMR